MSEIKKCRKCGEEILEVDYYVSTGKEDNNFFHENCLIEKGFAFKGGFLVRGKLGFQKESYSKDQLAIIAEELFVRLRKWKH